MADPQLGFFAKIATPKTTAAINEQIEILEDALDDFPDSIDAGVSTQADLDEITTALAKAKALRRVITRKKK